ALRGAKINGALSVDLSKITVSGNLADKVTAGTTSKISDTVDLKALANEKVFIDLGMGLNVDFKGNVNAQSAFNVSMPAISFLGYGMDANGNPNNIYNLLGDIATELEKDNFSIDKVTEFTGTLKKQETNLLSKITELGVRSNFLTNSKTRLEDASFNLSVQINETEYLDLDEAVMDFKFQEYVYKAALSMGSRVIQPSFLDFMR
ncbi:MAG: flagellar hook-associated protein 3, partial [Oscillospiraceae bacterium]